MYAIEVKNLVKKYKSAKTNAVDNISFNVKEGEFFAFLGPNGAGKTTTISILTTTLAKTTGTIRIAGVDLDENAAKVRAQIGVIFQNPSLDLNLTAEENIRFHAFLYKLYNYKPTFGLMPEDYREHVLNLAQVLGLKDDIFKPIKGFSGGMKRKLEIMRTLIHKPKILYLDEPTSGLDPLSRKNLWKYLQEIRQKEKTTIFLTTHYLDEAEGADHVCIINKGRIIIDDNISNIKRKLLKDHIYVESVDLVKLEQEVKSLNYYYEKDDKGLKIRLNNEDASAHKIIKAIDTPLTNIDVVQPTLEEAYLELVNEEGDLNE